MKFKTALAVGVVAPLFLLIGCIDKDLSKKDGPIGGEYFDFRTANNLDVNVQYDVPKGCMVFFEAYAEYPVDTVNGGSAKKEGLEPLFRGFTDENGNYTETVQVPTYVNEIYLYSQNLAVPMVKTLGIARGRSSLSRAEDTDYKYSSCPASMKVLEGGTWNAAGVPANLGPKKEITADGLNMLNATLGNKDTYVSDYIVSGEEANLNVVKDGATIDVVVVYNGGNTRTNTIGYYYYQTGNPPQTADEVQRILLFPNATFPNKGALERGDNVRLKYWNEEEQNWSESFPAGVTIGWFVLAGGYNANTYEVQESGGGRAIGYSNAALNDKQRRHNIIVRDPLTKLRYVGFEDQNFETAPKYRDFIFYIDADSDMVEYNDSNIPDGKDMTDTDGDGVPDVDDEYPNDADVAYSSTYRGTLAFEDIWPYQGDYDMNDVVMEYNVKHLVNKVNNVVRMEEQWTLKHSGAQLENGFGYQYGMGSHRVKNVEIESTYPKRSSFAVNAKGLEDKQTKPTVILFDNARDVMDSPEDQRTFTVKMTLVGPTKLSEVTMPPYNPFIIVSTNEGRGHEVHLPNFTPTDLMNTDLLQYGHDRSEPDKGIYFVSDNNMPFAIHIINESFVYPREAQRIDDAYPQFTKWASSFGEENKEWYKR